MHILKPSDSSQTSMHLIQKLSYSLWLQDKVDTDQYWTLLNHTEWEGPQENFYVFVK